MQSENRIVKVQCEKCKKIYETIIPKDEDEHESTFFCSSKCYCGVTKKDAIANCRRRSKNCSIIHRWFNRIKKHSFSFIEQDKQEIPKNGIYIIFEKGELVSHRIEKDESWMVFKKGELANYPNRIVKIGTHKKKNWLYARLHQHVNGNRNSSSFRKYIGGALLNKDKDPFLKQWQGKTKSTARNVKKFEEIEKRVTNYIKKNFSFAVFQVDGKKKRLDIETKLISTISECELCFPSFNWLGVFSPEECISGGGLWSVQGVGKTPLSDKAMKELKQIITSQKR